MKMLPYKLIALFSLFFLAQSASASMYIEKRRTIKKSFPINENTLVEINSKYGTINVGNWDKDSVGFRIEIIGRSKNEDFSQEMVDDTQIKFSASNAFVVMHTEFEDEGAQLITTLNKVTRSISGSQSEVVVNISLMVPKWTNLEFNHKFGDIFMVNHTGKIVIKSSYGDVRLSNIEGYTDIGLKFGDLNIQNAKRLNLDCEYANIIIFKVETADIESKGSKLNIHEIGKLRARTKRDDYTIYKGGSINADGSYSDIVVTDLSGSINFNGKFGDITVHNVQASFTQITMNCERSNANLSFDAACSFSLDLNLNVGDLTYPMGMIKVTEKQDKDGESTKYFGYVGTNPKPTSKLEVFGKETDVNITIK